MEHYEIIRYDQIENIMSKIGNKNMPVPFSIIFVTADRRKKTGGVFKRFDYVVKSANLNRKPLLTPLKHTKVETSNAPLLRDPNHWKNQTTNLAILAKDERTGQLKFTGNRIKVHKRLILFLNGRKVS